VVDIHSQSFPKSMTAQIMGRLGRDCGGAADGITHMVAATQRPLPLRSRISAGLLAHLQQLTATPKTQPGCDFTFPTIIAGRAGPSHRYVIQGTRYLLVEFSKLQRPQQTTDSFLKWETAGLRRSPIPSAIRSARESARVADWVEQGCVIQLTGSALTGFWANERDAPRYGCRTSGGAVLATDAHDSENVFPFFRAHAMPLPKSAAKKLPRPW